MVEGTNLAVELQELVLLLTRTFDAPRQLVFKAYSQMCDPVPMRSRC